MAPEIAEPRRAFEVGTTGWTADDLDDPRIEDLWLQGHYEIVEGVLTQMPPALYDPSFALKRLIRTVDGAIATTDPDGELVTEVDVILNALRVPRADAVYLSPEDRRLQREANAATAPTHSRRRRMRYGRILVPPTLIIESLSIGHEAHDRVTKRRWYAEAKVPNYWLLNAHDRSLVCLALDGTDYRTDAEGRDRDEVRPGLFPGLAIPLARLWAE
jgi:Uma2 family endonuclease